MTIRVACVGAGYFSQFHYASWRRLPDVALVGACDIYTDRAKATGLPAYDDLKSMLSHAQPELLDVILPPPAHAGTIRTALAAGIQWIICQKPFCQNLGEAEAVVRDAASAGATLIVHENFRFQPWYRVMKREIESGALGEILNAVFRLRPGDGQGENAYLDRQPYFQKMPRFLVHETAVHWIDTFQFLFGPATAVYADLRRINPVIAGEDAGYVIFDHAAGVQALFDGNRHLDHVAENARRTMGEALIEGTQGTLTLYGDGSVTRRAFGQSESLQVLEPDTSEEFGGDCVHALQSHVIKAMTANGTLENTAKEYLNVIAIKDAIYASADQGRKIALAGTE